MNYTEQILKIEDQARYMKAKTCEKLRLDVYKRALKYLEVNDIVDEHLQSETDKIVTVLEEVELDRKAYKNYMKSYEELKEYLRKEYQITEKGYYQNIYMVIGMVFGVAAGSVMATASAGLIGAGISIGIMLGYCIGKSKDDAATKELHVY